MKTLDQVEPRTLIPGGSTGFTISSEGSYYLGGNLTTSGSAITVAANNVTIDLQGFELIGGGTTGIFLNGGVSNVTIRNGTIRNCLKGIDGAGNSKVRVEKVRALNNSSIGIQVDINGAVIDFMVTTTNCLIIRNSANSNFVANYNIAAGNRYGPIVDITAGGTAAVNGSSAADTTTTHPWANFSH